ncbi:MAG: hypothetical protein ACEPOW_10150 [Bacteroidales bacterium]
MGNMSSNSLQQYLDFILQEDRNMIHKDFIKSLVKEKLNNKEEIWIESFLEFCASHFKKELDQESKNSNTNYISFLFGISSTLFSYIDRFIDIENVLEKEFPAQLIDYKFELNQTLNNCIAYNLEHSKGSIHIADDIDCGLQAHLFLQKFDQIKSSCLNFGSRCKKDDIIKSLYKRHLDRVASDEGLKEYEKQLANIIQH